MIKKILIYLITITTLPCLSADRSTAEDQYFLKQLLKIRLACIPVETQQLIIAAAKSGEASLWVEKTATAIPENIFPITPRIIQFKNQIIKSASPRALQHYKTLEPLLENVIKESHRIVHESHPIPKKLEDLGRFEDTDEKSLDTKLETFFTRNKKNESKRLRLGD